MMRKFLSLKSYQMMHRIGVTVVAAISMAGCASTPAPTERMIIARAAISNASSAGGSEFAPLQLKSAMEKMDAAERAMAKKDYVLARQLAEGDFRSRVEAITQTTARLADYFREKPESILAALGLPLHLEHLLKMLRQYAELSRNPSFPAGTTVAEALRKVEQTVENAALAFDGMYRQLLGDDVAALQASAASLEYLLGVQPDLERAHRQQPLDALAGLNPPPADAAPRPPRPLEKPS